MTKPALPHALPGDDAALGYVMREHPGHLDALEDLAADLAAQSRLPVATIWRALAGFAYNPAILSDVLAQVKTAEV